MHRASWVAMVLLATCLPNIVVNGVSLFQKLNSSSMVTQFTNLLQKTGLGIQMNSATPCSKYFCFLVFAPSDAAMSAAFASDPAGFSALDEQKLVESHYVSPFFPGDKKGTLESWESAGTSVGTDIGFGKVQIMQTGTSTLYWLANKSDGSFKINNAAIVVPSSNQQGDNGIFHVLDQVVLPIGSTQSIATFLAQSATTPIIAQLQVSKSLTIFNQWMQKDLAYTWLYGLFKGGGHKVRTVFLPSDAAWDRISSDALQQLSSSADNFRPVLMAHFGLDVCVFTTWMTPGSNIQFETGHSAAGQTFQAKMYLDSAQRAFVSVGGVVAKFVDKSINYPIADAIIHVVDRVLAFSPDTLASLAQTNAPGFYAVCMGVPSCQTVLSATNMQRTVFAPNDVTSLKNLNASMLEQVLLMHFVPGVLGKPDMNEADLVTAYNSAGFIRFRSALNKTRQYVEGRLPGRGFVRAELLMYDQPGKNGSLFHKIAFPLGQPYRTIMDFINDFQDLSSVSSYMGSIGFDPNLGAATGVYTVFPPNNRAMTAFANSKSSTGTAVGQTILKSQALRDRVFRRVVLPNQKIVADILASGATDYPTANTVENEKVNLNLMGPAEYAKRTADLTGVFVIASFNMTAGQYECTNGMVYPVASVLYRDSDIEGYTKSGTVLSSSVMVAVFAACVTFIAMLG